MSECTWDAVAPVPPLIAVLNDAASEERLFSGEVHSVFFSSERLPDELAASGELLGRLPRAFFHVSSLRFSVRGLACGEAELSLRRIRRCGCSGQFFVIKTETQNWDFDVAFEGMKVKSACSHCSIEPSMAISTRCRE